ncbi:MAG: hypothetical protein ACJ8F7_17485 [Gemmataceae bacterium]
MSALWIDDARLQLPRDASPASVYDHILSLPAVRISAQTLIEQGDPFSLVLSQRGLYVFQREWAACPPGRDIIIGSDGATTCHILLAVSPIASFCAHLDGAPGQILALMPVLRHTFGTKNDAPKSIDLHIAGGMDDRVSRELGIELLTALHCVEKDWPTARLRLRSCCVGPLNSFQRGSISLPAVRALAWDIAGRRLIVNGWFGDKGPQPMHRAAYSLAGTRPLVCSYDADSGQHVFGPEHRLEPPPSGWLDWLLSLDDEQLLRNASTSPHAEHGSFCAEMRDTLRYLRSCRGE